MKAETLLLGLNSPRLLISKDGTTVNVILELIFSMLPFNLENKKEEIGDLLLPLLEALLEQYPKGFPEQLLHTQ